MYLGMMQKQKRPMLISKRKSTGRKKGLSD
jgi:hypothetical protein